MKNRPKNPFLDDPSRGWVSLNNDREDWVSLDKDRGIPNFNILKDGTVLKRCDVEGPSQLPDKGWPKKNAGYP